MGIIKIEAIKGLINILGKNRESTGNIFKDKSAFSFDMLFQLSSMSVIAAAGVPRKLIFEYAAKLPCSAAEYFNKVEMTCERLKYDYAKACRLVGETTKEEKMRELLLRFSSSLLSGEPEVDFLVREAKAQAEDYQNDYDRKIETLKMWTDAYISLILSAVLIIIMGIVSTIIWEVSAVFIFGLVGISAATTAIGVWLIYLMCPREMMVLSKPSSKEQVLSKKAFGICLPIAIIISSVILLLGYNYGWVMLVISAASFPIGYISYKDDKKVKKRDSEIGTFLASLGGICAAIGTTVKESLGRIDMESINGLRSEVKRLYIRLNAGLAPRRCWYKFVEETGSELTNRSVGMFFEAVDMGGEPGQVGYHASLFANRIAMLRAKRRSVASPFQWLCITMHASVVSLLIFVSEIVTIFGGMVSQAEKSIPNVSGAGSISAFSSFNTSGLEILHVIVVPLVIILTISNTLAPGIVDGGSKYKFFYNLGIISFISAVSCIFIPQAAAALFKTVKL